MIRLNLIFLALIMALAACMPQAAQANDNNRGNSRNYQPQCRGRQVNVRRSGTGAVIGAFVLGAILNRVLNQSARPQGQPVYVPQYLPQQPVVVNPTAYPAQPAHPSYAQPSAPIDAVVGPVQLRFYMVGLKMREPAYVTIPDSQPVYAGCQIWFMRQGVVGEKFDVVEICGNVVTLKNTWGLAPDEGEGFAIVYPLLQ